VIVESRIEWTPAIGQAGTYPVTLMASDGFRGDIQQIWIHIAPDEAPVFGSVNITAVSEGSTMELPIPVSDPDGDPVQVWMESGPEGMVFEHGILRWTPDYSQSGFHPVTIGASDGLLESRITLKIPVLNTNRPPVIGELPASIPVSIGRLMNLTLSVSDPDGDDVVLEIPNLPPGANLSGTTVIWMPSSIQEGLFEITILASDGSESQSKSVKFRVS
jgi:hypothetical protein